MSKAEYLGDLVHTEKYTDRNGEEKKKYTKIGTKWQRPDKSEFYKILDSFVNFYPKKAGQELYDQAKAAVQVDDFDDFPPF